MYKVSLPYTTKQFFDHVEEHPPEFDTHSLALELEQCHGWIIGGRRYAVLPKPKRRTLTQCIAGWLLKRYDAWLLGGAAVDWSKGKR